MKKIEIEERINKLEQLLQQKEEESRYNHEYYEKNKSKIMLQRENRKLKEENKKLIELLQIQNED